MLIALVLPAAPAYSETFFRNKIRILAESGIRVIVFARDSSSDERDYELVTGFSWKGSVKDKALAGVRAFSHLARSPFRALRLVQLNKRDGFPTRTNLLSLLSSLHILNFDPDWLHFGYATSALGKENLATVVGARMAASIRGFDIAVYPLKNPGCYKLLWDRIDKLHYISDDLYSLALKDGFGSQTSHQKITPAIETSMFERRDRPAFGNPIKILTVARLHWKKGLECTLEGLKLLKAGEIDFQYTIVGEGEERERLVFASHQLGIQDRVHFVGKKTLTETSQFFRETDLYLQYSIQEGFCNAVLEAQATGLLCVVSDAEGLAENVLHGKTGWVVPKRSPRLLADQVLRVLSLPESERARISQAATERVRLQFDLEQQKEKFVQFYQ
jgi:colanic acid/amylovoran biosynthesis glycosyltransferase